MLKPMIAEKAKERMMSGKTDPNQKSDGGMTSTQLGKIAGGSAEICKNGHEFLSDLRYILTRAG